MALWDRQTDETEEEWVAFKAYRDQSPPRAIKRVAGMRAMPLADAIELCNRRGWKERVAAYDEQLDRWLQEEREAFVRQDARTRLAAHVEVLKTAREILLQEFNKLLDWSTQSNVGVIQPQQLAKMLDIVIKLERLVAGESTENTAQTIDLSGLSIDELRTMQGILDKAGISLPGLTGQKGSDKLS